MNTQFEYSVLQYKHSPSLGEAINIGLLFSFPRENKIHFVIGNTNRLKCVYPNFDTSIFNKRASFTKVGKSWQLVLLTFTMFVSS